MQMLGGAVSQTHMDGISAESCHGSISGTLGVGWGWGFASSQGYYGMCNTLIFSGVDSVDIMGATHLRSKKDLEHEFWGALPEIVTDIAKKTGNLVGKPLTGK